MVRILIVSSALFLFSACGSGGSSITVSMSDRTEKEQLVSFFTPNEITVAAGEKITFKLSNKGTVPHNLRIAGPDGEYNTDDDTLVGPEVLKAGETAEDKWTAPSQAGSLAFRCDFHLNTGTITVK